MTMPTELRSMLDTARISAQVECVGMPSVELIGATSAETGFVMIPASLRQGTFVGPFELDTAAALDQLPTTAIFMAGTTIDLTAGPETEQSVRLRAAEELVQIAENRLRTLERQRERLEAEIDLRMGGNGWEADDVAAAEQRLQVVDRRILKTRAKLDVARNDVVELLNPSNHYSGG